MGLKKILFKQEFGIAREMSLSYKLVIFLVAILAMLFYVAVMFYLFAWQIETPTNSATSIISIDKASYTIVAEEFKRREENFSQEESKNYSDPFQ